jgi:ATP-dependent Clp protease protease subunit
MAGTPPPAAASVNYPAHRYLTFFGQINPPSSSNLRLHLSNLVHQKARQVTLLFASGGGSTDDGMALFTYLRALPFELTIHAVGLVGSMGIPVFLAGKNRIASQNARFFFHDYTSNFVQYNGPMTREQQMGNTLLLTDAVNWTKDILKANTKLADSDFDALKMFNEPLLMDAQRAADVGIVSAIAEPAIPADALPWVVV